MPSNWRDSFIKYAPWSGMAEFLFNCDYAIKVIYLNSRKLIIEMDDLFQGTVNTSAIAPLGYWGRNKT